MRHTIAGALLCALLAGSAGSAQAHEKRTHYDLAGTDSKRGGFKSTITIVQRSGRTEILRWGIYAEGNTFQTAWAKRQADGSLTAKLEDLRGLTNAVSGFMSASPTRIALTITGTRIKSITTSAGGNGEAHGAVKGAAPVLPAPQADSAGSSGSADADAEDEPSRVGKLVQKGKHLIAAGKDKVKELIKKEKDKLVYDGVKLEETFKLSKYLHVGVGGQIEALKADELTAEQALTLSKKPRHVWLSNHVHGGVRIPLSTSIPIGDVSIGLGLDASAKVDYQVVDIYPLPEGVTDVSTIIEDLKTVAKRSFDLPLNAKEAERMNVGAVRVFDGNGAIAVNGNISIGHEVKKLNDVVRIGASARVGGFYRIQGDVRITVERLKFDQVRVRVRHGDTTSRGVDADLFLGASVDMTELKKELEPAVEYIDEALIDGTNLPDSIRKHIVDAAEDEMADTVRDKIKKVLRIRLYAGASEVERDELDISFVMRLSKGAARKAYERAVRGDFTEAAKLALEPETTGVRREFRVVSVENRTHKHASLELSILFKASASKDIRFRDLHVDDENGRTDYEVFNFRRQRDIDISLIDKRWRKDLTVEVIRRTRPGEHLADSQIKRSLRITLDHIDAVTYNGENTRRRRLIASWGLNMNSGLPTPESRGLLSRYGKTRTRVEVAISEKGIAAILAKGREKMLDAYARAYGIYKGDMPKWATRSGRDDLEHDHSNEANNEKQGLSRAADFADGLSGLSKARNAKERAEHLKQIANSARYDLYAASALIYLAPRDTLTLDASIQGERIRVNDGHVGGAYAVPVVDHR